MLDEATARLLRLRSFLRSRLRDSGLPGETLAIRFADVRVEWDAETGEVRTTDERN